MTPDERQMISGLFDRMRQHGAIEKDRDAEALIRDAVRQNPDATYMLVQTALVQEMVMQQSQQRVEELEERVRSLEGQARPQQQGSGSFLGGLFGGSRPAPAAAPSVPSAGRQSGGFGGAPGARPGSPWGGAPGAGQPMQQGGMMPMQQQQPAGGGFMRTAMATAAGVAGGMLAASAISNMMKGDTAQAAPASQGGNDPAGSYDAQQGYQDDGNDPAGSYDAAQEDQGGYDDGGSWSDE